MTDAKDNPYAHIADDTFAAAPRRDPELVKRILEDPRMHDHKDGFQSCIQCGVCTSGCPAARFTEYSPRETARRALDGDVTLLEDDDVWYCYYCYTCQSRCPRHNSVAVINQVVRGMQVESGRGRPHVEMFAEWCNNFYEKGMGGDPHLMFPAIGEAWGEKWTDYMEHLLEIRAELGLGDLSRRTTWWEVQTIFEATGFGAAPGGVRGAADAGARIEPSSDGRASRRRRRRPRLGGMRRMAAPSPRRAPAFQGRRPRRHEPGHDAEHAENHEVDAGDPKERRMPVMVHKVDMTQMPSGPG
jgi:heterodisulfide reductase subunit C